MTRHDWYELFLLFLCVDMCPSGYCRKLVDRLQTNRILFGFIHFKCLGRWWATLPRSDWPPEATAGLLADFDDKDHNEDDEDSDSVGDRRQEIVFIGTGTEGPEDQRSIRETLDQCLLSDSEYEEFKSIRNDEAALKARFVNPMNVRMVTF